MKIKILATLLASLTLQACDSSTASNNADTNTPAPISTGVNIRGVIASKAGLPIPGLLVKSKRTGLTTTTDANGVYRLTASAARLAARDASTDTGVSSQDVSQGVVDSVIVVSDSSTVTKMALKTMVDSLPALFLIQRNFSGKLLGNIPTSAKVVLSLATVGAQETKTLNLWFNNQAQSYSGFVYFVFDNLQHSWNTSVAVYDSADKLQAKTQAVGFNTSAGDIQFADISWDMYRPKVTGLSHAVDTSVLGDYKWTVAAMYSASWMDVSKDTLELLVSNEDAVTSATPSTHVYTTPTAATRRVKVYNGSVLIDSALIRWAAAAYLPIYKQNANAKYTGARLWLVGAFNRFGDTLQIPGGYGKLGGNQGIGLALKATDYPDPAWVCAQYAGATAAALAEIGCPLK